jgi:hypothetical protein
MGIGSGSGIPRAGVWPVGATRWHARSRRSTTGGFAFDDVPSGDAQLRFTGSGTDAAVAIGGVASQERISMTVSVTGSTAVVVSLSRDSAQELRVTGIVDNLDRAGEPDRGRRRGSTGATKIEEGSVHRAFADLRTACVSRSRGSRRTTRCWPRRELGGVATVPTSSPTPIQAPVSGRGQRPRQRAGHRGSCPCLFTVAGSAVDVRPTSFVKLRRPRAATRWKSKAAHSGAINATKAGRGWRGNGPTPTSRRRPRRPRRQPRRPVGAQVTARGAVLVK